MTRKNLLLVLTLLVTGSLSAQTIPSLKAAGEIQQFRLPCGISCYVTPCATKVGHADFALLQCGSSAERADASDLDHLAHLGEGVASRFLHYNAIRHDFVPFPEKDSISTMFILRDIDASVSTITDTVLLILFDLVSINPYQQAIIVSGDINASVIKDRMNALSMMVSPRAPKPALPKYEYVKRDFPKVETTQSGPESVLLSMTFNAPRTPSKMMSTILPDMTALMFSQLKVILSSRLKRAFEDAGIPISDITFKYTGSASAASDEIFSVSFETQSPLAEKASAIMEKTVSGTLAGVFTEEEVMDARKTALRKGLITSVLEPASNTKYINRCASSYLLGSSLAPKASVNEYFTSRSLPAEKECELFNSFVRTMAPGGGTVLRLDTYVSPLADTVSLFCPNPKKKELLKLTSEAAEPVTGGKMWTFSNGMRVIYKKLSTPGIFSYSLMLKGGMADIPSLTKGQVAFIPDMLSLCKVSGMSPDRFSRMLEANAISMETSVSLSDMRISGSAVKESFPLVMKSLISISRERVPDEDAFRRYVSSETFSAGRDAMSRESLYKRMDAILRPDYFYAWSKELSSLDSSLLRNTDRYFEKQFSKCNDGILMIMGDLDEAQLKLLLSRYLTGFRTSGSYALRPNISYTQASGCSTYTEKPFSEGGRYPFEGVFVDMSGFASITSASYTTLRMAASVLETKISNALCESGYSAEVEASCDCFPIERIKLSVTVLPGKTSVLTPLEVLPTVRRVLQTVSSTTITEAELKALKTLAAKEEDYLRTRPDFLIEASLLRYSEGKDLATDYKNRINAVKKEDIMNVLKACDKGGKVEFIVSR